MPKASLAQVSKLKTRLERLQKSTRKLRQKAGETVSSLINTAEIGGTAFVWGYAKSKLDTTEVQGIPGELIAAVSAHALSIMGVGQNMEPHLKAIGDGSLAAWAYQTGLGMGGARTSGDYLAGDYLAGAGIEELPRADDMTAGDALTEDDLAYLEL